MDGGGEFCFYSLSNLFGEHTSEYIERTLKKKGRGSHSFSLAYFCGKAWCVCWKIGFGMYRPLPRPCLQTRWEREIPSPSSSTIHGAPFFLGKERAYMWKGISVPLVPLLRRVATHFWLLYVGVQRVSKK